MSAADLIVMLPRAGQTQVKWTFRDRASGEVLSRGDLGEAEPPRELAARAILIAPSTEILVRRLDLPVRHESEARRAAPFALEEELASGLEETRIAVGPRQPDGSRLAFAAAGSLVERWQTIAARVGVRPAVLVPDAWALSADAGELVVAESGRDLLFFNNTGTGPVCGRIEAGFAATVLPALLGQTRPERLAITPGVDLPSFGDSAPQLSGLEPIDAGARIASLDPSVLRMLPALLGRQHAAATDWSGMIRPLRRVAALAAAALALFVAVSVGEGAYLRAQSDVIDVRAEDAFRAAFPDVERVVNLDAQLRQRAGAASGSEASVFLQLAGALSTTLADGGDIQVEALRFDGTRGELGVTATYPDFASFEALSRRAEANGLVIEDGGARQAGGVLTGDFIVRQR
ncbi:type II secretion system protein GspL [Hyphobacterium marinum]|uniref:Type II secretion system protein GspL n=1 Tax=Hyphobacterium marinum TaxID=3116574 RepID=A0ABU7LW38_9PROT|nr:type II secretion system protein GspL [Hyphobacterium sp. Y6023]MEE2565766.1 type II secretion system protein GspL [Hyphobacterium sp. Y6023]